jgi:hypothetical protein
MLGNDIRICSALEIDIKHDAPPSTLKTSLMHGSLRGRSIISGQDLHVIPSAPHSVGGRSFESSSSYRNDEFRTE